MPECKVQIDPIEFGQIKADNQTHKDHTKTVNEKLVSLEKKVDSIKWYILLGMVSSTVLAPEAKSTLLAFLNSSFFNNIGDIIQITYAKL